LASSLHSFRRGADGKGCGSGKGIRDMDLDVSCRRHRQLVKLIQEIELGLAILGSGNRHVRAIADMLGPIRQGGPDPDGLLWKATGLPESWWRLQGQALSCSDKQIRYCAARILPGSKMVRRARLAGYRDSKSLRTAAQSVDRSPRVQRLLIEARKELQRRAITKGTS
jgi:hypothetical protein